MAAPAGKGKEVFTVTILTFHTCKSVVEIATVQIPVNNLLEIGSIESVLLFKMFFTDLDKGFKMLLHALVVIGRMRITGTVNGGGICLAYFNIPS